MKCDMGDYCVSVSVYYDLLYKYQLISLKTTKQARNAFPKITQVASEPLSAKSFSGYRMTVNPKCLILQAVF